MSNYENGAYEALQWVWSILREVEDKPFAMKEARRVIHDKLILIGDGNKISFRKQIAPISNIK